MSGPEIKQAVQDAALRILLPLSRVLVEARVGIGEFHGLAKLAYVRAAVKGRRTGSHARPNVSRIAAATGLTRPEITTYLAQPPGVLPPVQRGHSRAESVLTGWHEDPEFLDPDTDSPATLKSKGARRSFASLVRRYSGDTNPAAILNELIRAGAARKLEDGRIKALRRTCANLRWDVGGIEALGEEVARYIKTLIHNLEHPEAPAYARHIECGQLDAQAARVVLPEIEEHADLFLESTGITLRHPRHTAKSESARKEALKVAVSVHVYQAPAGEDQDESPSHAIRTPTRTRKTKRPSRRDTNGAGAG